MTFHRCITASCVGLIIAIFSTHSNAEEPTPESGKIAFKLTPSYYMSSDGNNAADVNLRGMVGAHTAWIGFYRDQANFQQARTGYENRHDFGLVRSVLSAQLASGGFLAGSVSAEIGGDTFAIAGWGRTNLKNYYNLNFDPNDAITLGIGSRAVPKTELSLFHIWDDRLDTKQHVTHAVVRYKPTDIERWTVDASYKHGMNGDGVNVQGYALSVTYDYRDYFARIARDQYANFSSNTQNRFSLGLRF
jgi:hypothetical protein